MVEITMTYDGLLHTSAVHGSSGSTLATDAPKDNQGKGEAFSPTDLVATALGTCILTTMAIVAQRNGIELAGSRATVTKEMTSVPIRRIARLDVKISILVDPPPDMKQRLESAAHKCPVHQSLHPDVQAPITIAWGDGPNRSLLSST